MALSRATDVKANGRHLGVVCHSHGWTEEEGLTDGKPTRRHLGVVCHTHGWTEEEIKRDLTKNTVFWGSCNH